MTTYDAFQRRIDYFRISVTDRCNLRCIYCMPEHGVPPQTHSDILRYEEIVKIVRAAANLGITKVRITGGEPLARLGIVDLVSAIADIQGIQDLSMTTNGTLLAQYAYNLAAAGLDRVNISLDTLQPDRFKQITRWGQLEDVLAGIQAAYTYQLTPVKINTVVIRGLNDDEVVSLARKTITDGWHLRFIEWMPVGETIADKREWESKFVSEVEIRERIINELGSLIEYKTDAFAGPAHTYQLHGAKGSVGFISAVSHHFCAGCNRLRLTADGQLRPCLLSDNEIDLRTPLRNGATPQQIEDILHNAISIKPAGHHLDHDIKVRNRTMSQIGG